MSKYVFDKVYFRWDFHFGNPENLNTCDIELAYLDGPSETSVEVRARLLAVALKEKQNLTMLSTVDNYFTFDVSENIVIHPSVWYTCNVADSAGNKKQIHIKLAGIRHFGRDLDIA